MAVTAVAPLSAASLVVPSRKLALLNIHNGEDFEGVYWKNGSYDEKALKHLSYLLRDRRNSKEHPMDPQLFDLMHKLGSTLGKQDPFQIICGYRSKESNEKMHRASKGVAKNSMHLKGKAIDLRMDGVPLKELSNAARSLKAGGVGYYPKSNFVHIDIRPKVAFWT
jgi:uncharacterized protein YcbK (DUF882 family)